MSLNDERVVLLQKTVHLLDFLRQQGLDDEQLVMGAIKFGARPEMRPNRHYDLRESTQRYGGDQTDLPGESMGLGADRVSERK